jgi:hypothetical protein
MASSSRKAGRDRFRKSLWLCVCKCGKQRSVQEPHLISGVSVSCGCSRRRAITHGGSMGRGYAPALPEYTSWRAMHDRCSNSSHNHWHRYGGRGIRVCERWADFAAFLADMGQKPSRQMSIERLDMNGDYAPGNCVWATQKQQMRNMVRNRYISIGGITKLLCEWCEERALPSSLVTCRIGRGWSEEEALMPVGYRKKAPGRQIMARN